MKATVTSVEAILVDLPTIRAHQLAMTTMQRQTLVIVRLRCSDGIEGIGHGALLPPVFLGQRGLRADSHPFHDAG